MPMANPTTNPKIINCPITDSHTKIEHEATNQGTNARTNTCLKISCNHHRTGLAHNTNSVQPTSHVIGNILKMRGINLKRTA